MLALWIAVRHGVLIKYCIILISNRLFSECQRSGTFFIKIAFRPYIAMLIPNQYNYMN